LKNAKRRGLTTLSPPVSDSSAVESGRGQSGLSPSFRVFQQTPRRVHPCPLRARASLNFANMKKAILFALTFSSIAPADPTAPTINLVQNNYGQIPQSLPNYGIAPGTLMFIKGARLANTTSSLQSSAAPGLQTTTEGVSVTATAGGIAVPCYLYYVSPVQIDAVLPGTTPLGAATITVANNGAVSAEYQITVVPSAFGILTYGDQLAAAYHPDGTMITTAQPARPDETIVLWGSGLGRDPNNDDRLFPQKQSNLTDTPLQVLVGGTPAAIPYRGRSQFPGLDQVVITIPPIKQTGCYVALTLVGTTAPLATQPVLSATLPVSSDGRPCSDDSTELNPDIQLKLAQKGTINTGSLYVAQTTLLRPTPAGGIGGPNGLSVFVADYAPHATFYTEGYSPSTLVSTGSCMVSYPSSSYGSSKLLDAGPSITVTGPAGAVTMVPPPNPGTTVSYAVREVVLPSFLPAAGGRFTFDNGAGSKDLPHFSADVNLPPAFTWTNPPNQLNSNFVPVIDRRIGLYISWTGGGSDTFVSITGSASQGGFSCVAPVSAGGVTIPFYLLQALRPSNGTLTVTNFSKNRLFTAPGLDLGLTQGMRTTGLTVSYQ
jgi:uncharacterized protein (TIGR03437 family)